MALSKFALVLFDWDGCTAVLETRSMKGEVVKTGRVKVRYARVEHTVEILELSDSKRDLNRLELDWALTHRSEMLDREKERRGLDSYTGYLDVWPNSDEDEASDVDLSTSLDNGPHDESNTASGIDESQDEDQNTEEDTEIDAGATDEAENDQVENVELSPPIRRGMIQGLKQRVLRAERRGCGDYSGAVVQPKRATPHLEELSADQVDLLLSELHDTARGVEPASTQTDAVLTVSSEDEIRAFRAKPMVDVSCQSETSACECVKVMQCVEEMNKRLSVIESRTRKIDLMFDILKGFSSVPSLILPQQTLEDDMSFSFTLDSHTETQDQQPVAANPPNTQDKQPVAANPPNKQDKQPLAAKPTITQDQQPVAANLTITQDQQPLAAKPNTQDQQPVAANLTITQEQQPLAAKPNTQDQQPVAANLTITQDQQPVAANPTIPQDQQPVAANPTIPQDQQPVAANPTIPQDQQPVAANPTIPQDQQPVAANPTIPQDQQPVAANPTIPQDQQPVAAHPDDIILLDTDNNQQPIAADYGRVRETVTAQQPVAAVPSPRTIRPVLSRGVNVALHCSPGPICEISAPQDVLEFPACAEVRIHSSLRQHASKCAISNPNYAWLLTCAIFTKEELCERNFHGNKGKMPLSPRRRHAIEHAVVDSQGSNLETMQKAITAINTGIRNQGYRKSKTIKMPRQPFSIMHDNF